MSDVSKAQTPAPGPVPAPDGVGGRRPRIVGFLCDWAVSADAIVREDGTMRDLPNVTLIKVPCSGFVRPSWLEFALKNGAGGVFVCGCPLGDCFNRFGNNLIGDRVVQMRRRLERQKLQPERVAVIYYGLHEQQEFTAAVREFSDRVAALPAPPVPSVPPASRPVTAKGGQAAAPKPGEAAGRQPAATGGGESGDGAPPTPPASSEGA